MPLCRRPLCLVCCLFSALILVFLVAGIPFPTDPSGLKEVRKLIDTPRSYDVEGIVADYEVRDEYAVCTIRRAVLLFEGEAHSVGNVRCSWTVYNSGSAAAPASEDADGFHLEGYSADTAAENAADTAAGNSADNVAGGSSGDVLTLRVGTVVRMRGEVLETAKAENPGQFDPASYYRLQNVYFRMKNPEVEVLDPRCDIFRQNMKIKRLAAKQIITEVYPSDVSGILCAMLIGDRSELSEDMRSLWQSGGTIHMLAISGLHLTILGMGLFRFLKSVSIAHIARIRKMKNPLIPASVLSGAVMVLYTVFTGMSISTVRACAMFLLAVGAKVARRTYDPPTALAAAVLLILMESPYYLEGAGFLLSVMAVLVTFVFQRRSRLMTALFLYLWMLPLISYFYFQIPTLSILVNLLAVPLLPVILVCGIAGMTAGWAVQALCLQPDAILSVCAAPAVWLLRGINALLAAVSRIPYSQVITGKPKWWNIALFFAALAIWTHFITKYRMYKRRFLLLPMVPLIVSLLALKVPGVLRITAVSVGQGDSIAIEMPSGLTALVDGGSSTVTEAGTYRILPFLKAEGVRKVDYLFITHMDSDHYNGIAELLEMVRDHGTPIEVGTVVLPDLSEKDEDYLGMEELALSAGARVLHVKAGDFFELGDVRLDVLNPCSENETSPVDTNAQCIVLALHEGNFDALFTGDVCGSGEEYLTRELLSDTRHYEVLKVAHHGSRFSTPEEFLNCVKPDVSIISAGEGNRYGHPHRQLLERLEASGTDIYRTDEMGAVTVEVRGGGKRYFVKSFRE